MAVLGKPQASLRLERDSTTLNLEKQDAATRMHEDEVGLAIALSPLLINDVKGSIVEAPPSIEAMMPGKCVVYLDFRPSSGVISDPVWKDLWPKLHSCPPKVRPRFR
jgi:hypothetical protein